ncbi:MAG TPA: hypothetical protein VK459_23715, partial [Polyangiaceae bacterium]|nr:hypothetical protein [Polyangiaceae bacterium]
FASSVGAQGTIVLRLSCQTSKREYDRTETYTYTSRENYQALEEQSRLVAVGNPSTYTVDCPPDVVGQYNTRIRSCSTTETKVSPDYKTEQFEVEVTKSREVELKAQREVHYVEYTTTVNGEIAASAQATGPDENVIFKTSASLNATEKEGSYDQPTRQRIPADFGPHTAEQRVLAKAVGLVRGLLAEVQEGRAIPYVKEAEAAVSAGDRAAAEDSFMIAAEAIGRLAPSFKALLVDTYGFSDVDSASAKSGLHIGEVSRPDKPLEDNPPSTEETSRVDLEFDFLFTRLVSTDAAPQPGREALGGSWQVGSTVLTRIRDTTWGFGLYDFTWLKLYLGGRTAGFTDSTGEEEPGLSGAIEVGYRPYIGYRSSQWGVFLGGRGHLIAQALGNLHQSGALLALAGAVEWRVGGPGVLTLSGWATPAKSGDRTLGGELTLPFGRNGAGLKLAFEKRALSTSLPRTAEESTEYDGIGTRDAVTMSVGLTAWGE